jgi:hypothetical protein
MKVAFSGERFLSGRQKTTHCSTQAPAVAVVPLHMSDSCMQECKVEVCDFGVLLGVVCTFGSLPSAVVLVSLLLVFYCWDLLCSGPAAHQVRLLCCVCFAGLQHGPYAHHHYCPSSLSHCASEYSCQPLLSYHACKLERSKNLGSSLCMPSNARHEPTCMYANECHISLQCADFSQSVIHSTCNFPSPKRIMQVTQSPMQQSTFCFMCHLSSGAYHLVLTTMAIVCKVITVGQVSQAVTLTVTGHVHSCEQHPAPAFQSHAALDHSC